MRKLLFGFILLLSSAMCYSAEGGVLTSTDNPIISNKTTTVMYDGTGTNFANWEPKCYIHAWLEPVDGETFSQTYGTDWAVCDGDADYDNLDSKLKMEFVSLGQYKIDINIKDFFNVASEDLSKIGKIGIVVRTQYSGDSNQTDDFLLDVTSNDPVGLLLQAKNGVTLSGGKGSISVKTDAELDVMIYSLTGLLIDKAIVCGEVSFDNLFAGTYLVKINNRVEKVMVY